MTVPPAPPSPPDATPTTPPEPRPAYAAEFVAALCASLSLAFACNGHWLISAVLLAAATVIFLRSRPRDDQGRILLSNGRLLFDADGDSGAD